MLADPVVLTPLQALAVLGVGLLAGFFNVTAGGGSFLSVPLLILLGFPAAVANGTNRLALIVQNVAAIAQFRRGGVSGMRGVLPLAAAAVPGALLGAWLAVVIPELQFRRLFGGLMIAMTALVLIAPKGGTSEPGSAHRYRLASFAAFAAIGAYGGLIQAGVGFPIVFALSELERFTLVRCHAYKVVVVLVIQLAAIPLFIRHEAIAWWPALLLCVATSVGGHLGARLVLGSGERVLRLVFAVCAVALALRLLLG